MLGDEKMNEYGFGLKESMLFLVTIMLCIFITMFMYNKSFKEIFEGPSSKSYVDLENTLKSAGAGYVLNYHKPLDNGDEGYVSLDTLKDKNLINTLTDEKGKECDGYVFYRRDNSKMSYVPYLKCGSDYCTDGYSSSYE